jgi:hypothetical protein
MKTYIPVNGMIECASDSGTHVTIEDYNRLKDQIRDEESWWKERHDYKSRAEKAEAELESMKKQRAMEECATASTPYMLVWRDKAIEMLKFQARMEKAEAELLIARNALDDIIKAEPSISSGGDCFYPMHGGDGEYLGEQHVDPISVIGGMVQSARYAIDAAMKEGK